MLPLVLIGALWAASAPDAAAQTSISPADLMAAEARPADVRSSYGAGPLQFGDLYLPDGDGPHPVFAFIHGGCFLSQFDIAHSAPLAEAVAVAVADAGYAAASPMVLVPVDEPVTFVVGALDGWTPPAMSWLYRARAPGSPDIDLVELPESGHFEMIAPWSSSWPAVMEALERTFDESSPE